MQTWLLPWRFGDALEARHAKDPETQHPVSKGKFVLTVEGNEGEVRVDCRLELESLQAHQDASQPAHEEH